MKKLTKRSIRIIDVVVIGIAISLISFGIYNRLNADNSQPCNAIGQNHPVFLDKGNFTPRKITVGQCDTVIIVNRDASQFNLAFGSHQKHIAYPGFREQLLRHNESISIDMVMPGTYTLHDHYRPDVTVDITVASAK